MDPGDWVTITLNQRIGPNGGWSRPVTVAAMVMEIDPPGLPRGVKLHLEDPVNGTRSCFASHEEVTHVGTSPPMLD